MNKRKKVAKLKQRQNKKRFEALRRASDLTGSTTQERRSRSAVSNVKQSSSQIPTATKPAKKARSADKVVLEAPLKQQPQAEEIEASDPPAVADESSNKINADELKKAEQPDSASEEKPKRTRTTSKKSTKEENPKRTRLTVKKTGDA